MAGYTYETISKDPKKQEELLSFLDQFEKILTIDNSKMKKEEVINGDMNKVGLAMESEAKPRFLEVISDMRETMTGKTVEHELNLNDNGTTTFTCDFNRIVDYMRGRMVSMDFYYPDKFDKIKTIPGADAFLKGIGMPERGTVGYYFDTYSDNQVFSGGYKGFHKRETSELGEGEFYGGAFAALEMSGGAENWRDVKVDEEKMANAQSEYKTHVDTFGADLVSMISDPEAGGMDLAPLLFAADPKALTGKINEVYFSKVASSNLKKAKDHFNRDLRDFNAGDELTVKKITKDKLYRDSMLELKMPNIIQSTLATSKPPKFNNYIDVMKEERKYRHLYKRFLQGRPMQETVEFLAKDPSKLLDTIAPPAKSRIEMLQGQIKKERDAAKKMRLAAEIIANRELAGAQLGGKGLENRPDPDQVEKRAAELAAEMAKVRESNPKAMDKLLAQATSGHGGKMLEAYNKTAQPTREAAKPITYLDYINKLNLETPTEKEVSRLAAATMLFVQEKDGAQALTQRERIEKLADTIAKSPAFEKLMQDPNTLQNAKVGFGLRITEQLRKETESLEAAKKQDEAKRKAEAAAKREKEDAARDKAQIERDMKDPQHRIERDEMFFKSLREYGVDKEFDERRRYNVQKYLDSYPSCRAEAQEIIRENKLQGLKMPKIREVPDQLLINPQKNKEALQAQQQPKMEAEGGARPNAM